MTKEELIKIYSAYYPYRLKVNHCNIEYAGEEEFETFITGIFEDCITFQKGADFYYDEDDVWIKPHLYDLSHLTNDEFNFIWENETDFEGIENFISLDWESRLTCKFSYSFWTELFKNHFNVFNLPEDQFINKATLNHGK